MSTKSSLQVPFDISLTPDVLLLGPDDSPSQNAALQAAISAPSMENHHNHFSLQPRVTKTLQSFKNLFERKHAQTAINLLAKHVELNYKGNNMTTPVNSPDIVRGADETFMDLHICVSNGIRLGSLLTKEEVNHNYEMQLDLRKKYRVFSTRAKVGFDPKGCIIWTSKSLASEDVWLAWAPTKSMKPDSSDVPAGFMTGSTTMSNKHYRMVVMFLATMLVGIGYCDITVYDKYPSLNDEDNIFKHATNLL